MINLFNIENYKIDTSKFNHILHDNCVIEFENTIADYVGAKYACGVSSATNAIYLAMNYHSDKHTITIPSMIPPVLANPIPFKVAFLNQSIFSLSLLTTIPPSILPTGFVG